MATASLLGAIPPAAAGQGVTPVISLDPDPGNAFWTDQDVQVTLSCDPPDTPACQVDYVLDDVSNNSYSGPFSVTTSGSHQLRADLVRPSPPTPTSASRSFGIDKLAPAVTLDEICSVPGSAGWCRGSWTATASVSEPGDASGSPLNLTCKLDGSATTCAPLRCDCAQQNNVDGCTQNCAFVVSGDGTHNASAIGADLVGHTTIVSHDLKIDTTPPVPPSILCTRLNEGAWCVAIAVVAASDATSGVAEETCSIGELACSSLLTEQGAHSYASSASDNAGNSNTSEGSYQLDSVKPTLAISTTCPTPGTSGWCNGAFTYAFFANDSGEAASGIASTVCRIDGNVTDGCSGTLSTAGMHTLNVTATDNAGNTNTTQKSFGVDLAGPSITITNTCTSLGNSPWCRVAQGFILNVSDDSGSTPRLACWLDADSESAVPCSSFLAGLGALQQGMHTLHVRATDASGRTSEATSAFSFDGTAPSVSLALPESPSAGEDGWFVGDAPTLGVLASDAASGIVRRELSVDGGHWINFTSSSLAPNSLSYGGFFTAQGDHVYRIRATDAAGNVAIGERRVRLDIQSPRVLDTQVVTERPGDDDPGLTKISFAFNEPMDPASTEAALTGASNWTRSWGADDLWLNLTRTNLSEGLTASVTLGGSAQGRHGGTLGSPTTRTAIGRGGHQYYVQPIPYDFTNISANGTDTGIYCDDCGVRVVLPFTFTYFDRAFADLNVSSNGFITFGRSDCLSNYVPRPLDESFQSGSCVKNLVAAYWEDLDVRSGSPSATPAFPDRILTKTIGEAPNRVFIISWNVVHHYPQVPPTATFEMKLYEGTNVIETHYDHALSDGGSHLIGLVNGNGTRFTTYSRADLELEHVGLRYNGAFAGRPFDNVPPSVSISLSPNVPNGLDGWYTGTVTATIVASDAGVGADPGVGIDPASLQYSLNGGETWTSGSTFAVPAGTSQLRARAADQNGNPATSAITTVKRDSTPPLATITLDPEAPTGLSGWYNGSVTASLSATDGGSGVNATTLAYSFDNETWTTGTSVALPEGTTTLLVRVSDVAGNTGQASLLVKRDATGPTITIALTPPTPTGLNGWYNSSVTAGLSATDAASGVNESAFAHSLDGSTWTAGTTLTLPQGESLVRARASDLAGNNATATRGVKVDTVAPTVLSSNSSNDRANGWITFNFSEAMDRDSTDAALENATGWTRTWSEDGRQLVLNTSALAIGALTITIDTSAKDAHGNPMDTRAPHTITRIAEGIPPPPPPPPQPPAAPPGFRLALEGLDAHLAWSAPASGASSYRLRIDGGPAIVLAGTSYVARSLSRGAVHTFTVSAVNELGEGESALTSISIAPVSVLDMGAPNANGWYTVAPTASFTVDPASARIVFDVGDGPVTYSGPFTLPGGEHDLRWHAESGDTSEGVQERHVAVDDSPPLVDSVGATTAGRTAIVTARVAETGSGLASVEAIVGSSRVGMSAAGDGSYRASLEIVPGTYDITVIARDVAGNEGSAGPVQLILSGGDGEDEDVDLESETGDSVTLEHTSNDGGQGGSSDGGTSPSDPTQESSSGTEGTTDTGSDPEPTPPSIQLGDGQDISRGIRGQFTIVLHDVPDLARMRVVIISELGVETLLSEGIETTVWDTTLFGDGYYTIELRRAPAAPGVNELTIQQSSETSGQTIASERALVRNDVSAPAEVAGEIVGAALITATANVGLSAIGSGAASSASSAAGGFDPFGFAQEVAIDAGQDKLKAKTLAADRRRRAMRSWFIAFVSLGILAALWAFSQTEGWSYSAWLRALPIVGLAAALVMLMKYSSESAMAYATKARPRVRLWIAGTISLAISSIVFRNPFGYPGYVDEVDESEARNTWRMQALRALATLAGAAAFMLPFLLLSGIAPWSFVSVGLLLAVTNVATGAMPFGPLPGRDVWRWNKWLAVGVGVAGFGLYFAFAAGYAPIWSLWVVAITGAVIYAASLVVFRRKLAVEHSVSVPVQVPVPVKDEEAQAPVDEDRSAIRKP